MLQGAPGLLSIRAMSIFAITSHKYTLSLYTPGQLEIIWELVEIRGYPELAFTTHSLLSLVSINYSSNFDHFFHLSLSKSNSYKS